MTMSYFKNAAIYKLSRNIDFSQLGKQMQAFAFTPCGSQDAAKSGWVAPFGEELVYRSNGQILVKIQREEKILPAPVIARELAARVEKLEAAQQRRLKKTEKDTLRDEVVQTLLPRAFSKYHTTAIWINEGAGLIVVDAASAKKAEDALALLRKTIGSLPVLPLVLETPIELTVTEWVRSGNPPAGFSLSDEAELKAVLEDGGVLSSKHQDLVSDEIATHIRAGKLVTRLALDWQERINFVLTDAAMLKRLKFSANILEQNDDIDREDAAARFDADFVLMTGELSALISALIAGLGGVAKADNTANPDTEGDNDPLYEQAVKFVVERNRATISGIQREFRIGYNRGARLIELMEVRGVVSALLPDGSRNVLAVAEGA
ncbi:Recombination-associated protein RdgC [Paramixta manurensis]|uniref:Recombination-associated protein RdgC n=1 Tax=Paramixta manurensis TaxID=2740817 RepID=A0A6M8UER7_9GAMM|nr:Recombination-associated protein RdgC [Erwiniaceae bacterium PD-1]